MKFKSKIIIVFLATLTLIISAQKAFGAGELHQVKKAKIQFLVCINVKETQIFSRSQFENSQPSKATAKSFSPLAQLASNSTWQIEVFLWLISISSISLGIVLHIKQRNCDAVLWQNVEMLERAWKISPDKTK